MATISISTDQPIITPSPLPLIVTGGTKVTRDNDIREMFRTVTDYYHNRVEPNHTLYLASGWNSVFFRTDEPIVCNNYRIWFSEDFNSGNRCTRRFKLLSSLSSLLTTYQILDDVTMQRPYKANYGNDAIVVENSLPAVSAQYFQLWFLTNDWGILTDGSRINGFELT